ncbi:MAG: tRNA (adenosine(37)-N6)-dimethylallyltransferase MiaA [Pseudomonadales bacterium]|nr:tRNA (adenosine(37)-N6)-dimethylallyltransferase MiaA [Pseudomonadales bacterium]
MAAPKKVPQNTVLSIMGPTASGKTQVVLELAEHLPIDIISVDSALVYRDMDIGTAKPSADILQTYPHALVDIIDPRDTYSAASFQQDADQLVKASFIQGRLPVLVGGSSLYFKAFKEGLAELPGASPQIRQDIAHQAEQAGWPSLYDELARVDPKAAEGIHPQNSQRIQRALEVFRATGKPISRFWEEQATSQALDERLSCRLIECSLEPERAILHQRIEQRFVQMLESGFEQEVRKLHQRGDLTVRLPSMRCVGYRQMWMFLQGELTGVEMIAAAQAATRQLAKRQLTWLRKWPVQRRIDSLNENAVEVVLKMIESDPIVMGSAHIA